MIKQPFIAMKKPGFEYTIIAGIAKSPVIDIALPEKMTLMAKLPFDPEKPLSVKTGDPVKTGQRILLSQEEGHELVSTVTGTIAAVSSYRGSEGQNFTAVTIETDPEDDYDLDFRRESKKPALDTATPFLSGTPGEPPFHLFGNPEKPIKSIVIYGGDSDLLLTTSQYVVQNNMV